MKAARTEQLAIMFSHCHDIVLQHSTSQPRENFIIRCQGLGFRREFGLFQGSGFASSGVLGFRLKGVGVYGIRVSGFRVRSLGVHVG